MVNTHIDWLLFGLMLLFLFYIVQIIQWIWGKKGNFKFSLLAAQFSLG